MTIRAQDKVKTRQRPEKTLNLHLRLILKLETAYNKKEKEKKLGKEESLITRAIRFKCPVLYNINKNHKEFKEIRRQKSTETSPGKDLITYILDKKFKMTVLAMLKELREEEEKVKKTMF